MIDRRVSPSSVEQVGRHSRYRPWLFLAVLTAAHLFGVLDRVVISLLVEPIKADLGLSDTEISLLQGLAFMLGLVVMLIPMGVAVDRMSRTRLLAGGMALWSVMTALCGMANSFGTLFMARFGIAVGEASLHPTCYSLVSDLFDKRRLGIAISIFMMGGTIGTGLSFVAGGAVIGAFNAYGDVQLPFFGVLRPWQLTFISIAIPGLLMALVVRAIADPPRGKMHASNMADGKGSWDALKAFYRENRRFLISHHIAMGATAMALLGAVSWIAPLLSRVYGWDAASIGVVVGIVTALVTPVGLLGGGFLGDYLMPYGAYMRLVVCAAAVGLGGICGLAYPLVSDSSTMLVLYGGMTLFVTLPMGVGNAALQQIAPNEIRGRVGSIYYLTMTVVQVAGPTLIAGISDIFFPFHTGVRYSTAIVISSTLLLSLFLFCTAIRPYRRLTQ